jgi:predicted DNA-binding protein
MGGKRKIAGEGEKLPAMTCYIPKALKERHQQLCKAIGIRSQSERIRKLMEKDLEDYEGKHLEVNFDFEAAKDLRLKWKRTEDQMKKILDNESCAKGKSAYEYLCLFFNLDRNLEKDIDKVLARLHQFECSGQEPFNGSTVETFIEYLEAVVERRQIEVELKFHRRQSNKASKLEESLVTA